jgi:uncharacterized protein YjbI with pentapeptide repeats
MQSADKTKSKNMKDKSAKILLDVPVDDGVLGFDNYRDALIDIIKSSDPHFTIGIFGGWGTGKTTLMKMMRKELDKDEEITVWFNPWQYEKEIHLLIPLVQTINLELQTNHKDIVGEDTVKKITGLLKKVGRSIKPELTVGIAKVGLDSEKLLEEEKEDLTSLYFELNQELENVIEKIQKTQKERIVIFIDDLDRCLPDKALQVLESIKGFLDMDGYVFVLGLSRDIIEKCVDAKYKKESGISGSYYLRKMIQVPFTLPDLREEETRGYVEELKKELKGSEVQKHIEDYIDIIVGGMEANPREIKRFVNNFILANQISQRETQPAKLLVILIIQFRWDSFYRDLVRHKNPFLEQTTEILRKKEELEDEERRKKASESWSFFELIEAHLKDDEFRDFLEGAGKILFEIGNLDPYIHFSKSVVIEDAAKKERSKQELLDLLRSGRIKEFNRVRPYPFVDLSLARLALVDLRGATLSGVNLEGAKLTGTNLSAVDLSGANLSGASLTGADLRRDDLRGANLSGAYLWGANLTHADLMGTNLTGANLRRANLSGADLRGANLKKANLWGANLRDIVVDDSIVFDKTIIQNVRRLSPRIRERLHIESGDGVEKARSNGY